MTEYKFTYQDVYNKILELGNRFPNFNYKEQSAGESCSYLGQNIADSLDLYTGQGCIVGQALRALGVSRDDLFPFEGETADYVLNKLIPNESDPALSRKIANIQANQDCGHTWGRAIR